MAKVRNDIRVVWEGDVDGIIYKVVVLDNDKGFRILERREDVFGNPFWGGISDGKEKDWNQLRYRIVYEALNTIKHPLSVG